MLITSTYLRLFGVCLSIVLTLRLVSSSLQAQSLDSASIAIVRFDSEPPGAHVYVDGISLGVTPCDFIDSVGGIRTINVTRETFVPITDTLVLTKGQQYNRSYQLVLGASLIVGSNPDRAGVYLDDVYQGTTPLSVSALSPGSRVLKIIKSTYIPIIDTVMLAPGIPTPISVNLVLLPVHLRITSSHPDLEVSLNEQTILRGTNLDTIVAPGQLEILAKQLTSGRTASLSLFALPKQELSLRAEFGYRSLDPFYASLKYPGVGQTMAGQRTLGWTLGAIFWGSAAVAVGSPLLQMVKTSDYERTIPLLSQATNAHDAKSLHEKVASLYSDITTLHRMRNYAIATAIVVYLISAADAYFIHHTQDFIMEESDLPPDLPPIPSPQASSANFQWRISL